MKRKIYALFWPDGRSQILEKPWSDVRKAVAGVSNLRYKGFEDMSKALEWIEYWKEMAKYAPKRENRFRNVQSDISRGEARALQINTPTWKRRNVFYRRELDQQFKNSMRKDKP